MSAGMRFEICRTAHTQWHWRIVASNGRILASSENYRRKVGCERAIESVRTWSAAVEVPVHYVDDRLKPMPRPELPAVGA